MLSDSPVQTLDISACGLSLVDGAELARVLQENGSLTALDASFNFVAPGWHFASMLEENATLRSLNLSGTGLDDAGLKPI